MARSTRDSWAWWRPLQMRSLVAFADLAQPASEPNAHSSPGYFSQKHIVFPKIAEESSVGFSTRNTRFFPLLSLLRDLFFHFWRAERHKAVTFPVAECFQPPAEHPVPFPVRTRSRSSSCGPARRLIASHVLQRTCQCL